MEDKIKEIILQAMTCNCCNTTIKDYDKHEELIEEFVQRIVKLFAIHSVVSSKITVSVTYLKWHDSGHDLLDDYSTKETKIVKVNDVEEVNDMFTNVIKIKIVK